MEFETATSYRCKERRGLTASNVTSLFQPDTVLSAQFFDDRRRKTLLEAEKRLMLAIMEDAVHCFQDHHLAQHGKRKRLFDDVHRWFFEASSDWLCGFENISSVLGLNTFARGWCDGAPKNCRSIVALLFGKKQRRARAWSFAARRVTNKRQQAR